MTPSSPDSLHSQLPWRVMPTTNTDDADSVCGITCSGEEEWFVADVWKCDGTDLTPAVAYANAAFIVRCVNVHDELVAALKEMVALNAACFRVIAGVGDVETLIHECRTAGVANGAGVRAQAVLAKAEAQ